MIISRYGLRFHRLKKEDLDLLRKWRNEPAISQFMEFRDHITPEMHLEWFEKINNSINMYFVIEYNGKKIGLINGKNMDWEEMSMEGGIFFWDKDVLNTQVPITCAMIMAEFGIFVGGLKTYAHIMRDNERAIRFNTMVGFELCDGQDDVENQQYVMTMESYLKGAKKLRKAFYGIYGNKPVEMVLEKLDYDSGLAQSLEKHLDYQYLVDKVEGEDSKTFYFEIDPFE